MATVCVNGSDRLTGLFAVNTDGVEVRQYFGLLAHHGTLKDADGHAVDVIALPGDASSSKPCRYTLSVHPLLLPGILCLSDAECALRLEAPSSDHVTVSCVDLCKITYDASITCII